MRDELLSELSEEEGPVAAAGEPPKTTIISFRHKDDADLFGLGLQEEGAAPKDSSEDQEGERTPPQGPEEPRQPPLTLCVPLSDKESKQPLKDKKKKKKKSKEVTLVLTIFPVFPVTSR